MNTSVDLTRPAHPLDTDLVDYADGLLATSDRERVHDHLLSCARCRQLIEDLGPAMSDDDLTGVVSNLVGDQPLISGRLSTEDPAGEPQVGDLWLVEWNGSGLLAAVLNADGAAVSIAPATAEAPDVPAAAVAVGKDDSPTGGALYLWGSLRMDVPLGVFLRPAGQLPSALVNAASSMQTASRPSWDDVAQRVELAAVLDVMATATWLRAPADDEPLVALAELLRTARLRPQALSERSGVPVAVITALLRENRQATPEEATLLAEALDVEPTTLRRPVPIPAALALALERPVHRASVRARALAAQVSEALARLAVAEAVVATPARTTPGERDVETWDQLIRHHLDG